MDIRTRTFPLGLMALLALAVISGCAGSPGYVPRSEFVEFTPEQKVEIARGSGKAYKVQEGDVLKLGFAYLKDLDQDNVIILPDGSANFVGIDRVVLEGLTLSEADSILTAKYSTEFKDPQLTVIVKETQGRKVYVLGEVKNPGLHALPRGGIGIVGAVTVAGGFTDEAAKGGVALARVTPEGYLVQEIDLSGFHTVEYSALAGIPLEPFDIVYVPRSRVGDFAYFSKTVLQGILNLTRIASDVKYISGGTLWRY
jgi:protein involved in polysaccharide export with SLBB domain